MAVSLFLDLSTHTGWACDGISLPGIVSPLTGAVTLPEPVHGRFGSMLTVFADWLAEKVIRVGAKEIGYEGQFTTGRNADHALLSLGAVVQLVAFRLDLPTPQVIYPNSIKARFAGDGRADKAAIIANCQRLGWNIGNPPCDDRADAAAGWACMKMAADRSLDFRPLLIPPTPPRKGSRRAIAAKRVKREARRAH